MPGPINFNDIFRPNGGLILPQGGQVTEQFTPQREIEIESPTTGKVYKMPWDLPGNPPGVAIEKYLKLVDKPDAPPPPPQPSASEQFWGPQLQAMNPISMATGTFNAITHPIDTLSGIAGQMGREGIKGKDLIAKSLKDLFTNGPNVMNLADFTEGTGHLGAAAIPILGPAAAKAGEEIGKGNWASGLGQGAAAIESVLAPGMMSPAIRYIGNKTGISKAPAALMEAGLGVTRKIREDYNAGFGDIGQTALDQGIVGTGRGFENALQRSGNRLRPAVAAYDQANPLSVDRFHEIAKPAYDYGMAEGDIPNLSAINRDAGISGLGNAVSAEVQDIYNTGKFKQNLGTSLEQKMAEGNRSNWSDNLTRDPVSNMWSKGVSKANRQAIISRVPIAEEELGLQQKLLGGAKALTARELSSPSTMFRRLEVGALAAAAKYGELTPALYGVAALELMHNPVAAGSLAQFLSKGGRAATSVPGLQAAILGGMNQDQQDATSDPMSGYRNYLNIVKGIKY